MPTKKRSKKDRRYDALRHAARMFLLAYNQGDPDIAECRDKLAELLAVER